MIGTDAPRTVDAVQLAQVRRPQLTSTERIRFVLDQLMDRNRTTEMTAFSREWDRAVDGSPNRLDAAVWGITRLSKVITQIPIA